MILDPEALSKNMTYTHMAYERSYAGPAEVCAYCITWDACSQPTDYAGNGFLPRTSGLRVKYFNLLDSHVIERAK